MVLEIWQQRLRALPTRPGVYLLKDRKGTVLYVGKASSLHQRLRAYFVPPHSLSAKQQGMMEQVTDFEFIVTDSEQEALLLENNLIKKYRPRYNVMLKDDKSYPLLKITLNEPWPGIYITRRLLKDGARYFGPFASASSVRQTLNLIKRLFPLRFCTRKIDGKDSRPCLAYHLNRCLGPCIGAVGRQEYESVIKQATLFLEGKQEKVVRELRRKMEQASKKLEFERARFLRDQLKAVEIVIERQKIFGVTRGNADAIAFVNSLDQAYVQVFFIRNGKLMGREHFILQGTRDEEPEQIMTSFIKQFYQSAPVTPRLLLLQHPVEDKAAIEEWLGARRGRPVKLVVPRRGEKKQLVQMVADNARQGWEHFKVKQLSAPEALVNALEELKEELDLPQTPQRMECYDISNVQGRSAVGSMVVFEKGVPRPSHYRRFRIKTVDGADDYAMLQEVLRRRFKRAATAEGDWGTVPDLLIVDGGKGQLNAALEVMEEVGAGDVPVASIAKEREEIFLPDVAEPVVLPRNSPALFLVQRIRDEAHRFAISYFHKVHGRKSLVSALDSIPGIGPKRKRALLKKFGSVQGIKEASVPDLTAVPGMTAKLAEKLKQEL